MRSSSRASRSRYGPHAAPRCCPSDGKQHGKFNGRLRQGGRLIRQEWKRRRASAPTPLFPPAETELLCGTAAFEKYELRTPPLLSAFSYMRATTGTHCRFALLIHARADRYFVFILVPNWFEEALKDGGWGDKTNKHRGACILRLDHTLSRADECKRFALTAQKLQFKVKCLFLWLKKTAGWISAQIRGRCLIYRQKNYVSGL